MKMSAYIAASLLLSSCIPSALHAQQYLLKSSDSGSNGVQIVTGSWSEERHSDKTYMAFRKFRGNKSLGEFDYYYQFRIAPQFHTTFIECSKAPYFQRLANAIIGTSGATLVMAKLQVAYHWTPGQEVQFLKDPAPLFVIATGSKSDSIVAGNGCFFDVTQSPTFPLLRYAGGGNDSNYDDFDLKFSVSGGEVLDLSVVNNVATAFGYFNAAFAWNQMTKAATSALQSSAQAFQDAVSKAGTFNSSAAKNYNLKQNGLLRVSIPTLFPGSDMVIYSRRQASIALDTSEDLVRVDSVLQKDDLAARQCSPKDVSQGACTGTKSIIDSLMASSYVKAADDKVTYKIVNPGLPEKQKLIFDVCEAVRTHIRLNMRLSTLDEMMVRWALTKDLRNALKDPSKTAAILSATKKTIDEIKGSCWNDGDEKTVTGVAKLMGKTLEQ